MKRHSLKPKKETTSDTHEALDPITGEEGVEEVLGDAVCHECETGGVLDTCDGIWYIYFFKLGSCNINIPLSRMCEVLAR